MWLAQRKPNKRVFSCCHPTRSESCLTQRAESNVLNLQQRVKWKDWRYLQGGTPPVRDGELALLVELFLFYNDTPLSPVHSFKKSWIFLPTPSLIDLLWWRGQKQPAVHSSLASVCFPFTVRKLKSEDYPPFININDELGFWLFVILSIIITFRSGEERHVEQYVYKNKHKLSGRYSY